MLSTKTLLFSMSLHSSATCCRKFLWEEVWSWSGGSTIHGACMVHARCVYWGDFVDLPLYSIVKCMCFQAVKCIPIAHTALCRLTVSPMSLSWPPAGVTVTYTQLNGDRVPATVISASECGQYVSIEYDTEGHRVSDPTAPAHQIKVCIRSPPPSPDRDPEQPDDPAVKHHPVDHPEPTKK